MALSAYLLITGCGEPDTPLSRNNQPPPRNCAEQQWTPEETPPFLFMVVTDAGMHGLWDPYAFQNICDFHQWEAVFVSDDTLEEQIREGRFVPVYVHSDGAPAFEVRIGSSTAPALLTPSERKLQIAESQDYLFVSQGIVNVDGIEYIYGWNNPDTKSLALPAGRWKVRIHLLHDPSMKDGETNLYPPDFLITLNPESEGSNIQYRQSVETFDVDIWELL